jgi:hypothetical protein
MIKFTEEIIQGYLRIGSNGEKEVLVINRFQGDEILAELLEDEFARKTVTVRYYVCPTLMTLEEAEERFIRDLFVNHDVSVDYGEAEGEVEAEYGVYYSEITGYLWTDEGIVIGGHDLLKELYNFAGHYLILVVDVHD